MNIKQLRIFFAVIVTCFLSNTVFGMNPDSGGEGETPKIKHISKPKSKSGGTHKKTGGKFSSKTLPTGFKLEEEDEEAKKAAAEEAARKAAEVAEAKTKLFDAINARNIDDVKTLLKKLPEADIEKVQNAEGKTYLVLAAENLKAAQEELHGIEEDIKMLRAVGAFKTAKEKGKEETPKKGISAAVAKLTLQGTVSAKVRSLTHIVDALKPHFSGADDIVSKIMTAKETKKEEPKKAEGPKEKPGSKPEKPKKEEPKKEPGPKEGGGADAKRAAEAKRQEEEAKRQAELKRKKEEEDKRKAEKEKKAEDEKKAADLRRQQEEDKKAADKKAEEEKKAAAERVEKEQKDSVGLPKLLGAIDAHNAETVQALLKEHPHMNKTTIGGFLDDLEKRLVQSKAKEFAKKFYDLFATKTYAKDRKADLQIRDILRIHLGLPPVVETKKEEPKKDGGKKEKPKEEPGKGAGKDSAGELTARLTELHGKLLELNRLLTGLGARK